MIKELLLLLLPHCAKFAVSTSKKKKQYRE
jgi:hypothetical protein